ncbi:SusD/RagB family nutrient-binding outer membrane lipoprotein [Pseudoflavitalea sp. G-6-1-2]|uniref:SusD/RagB family nutrient-binding outer membrane lipoprotein n=1 Tax=Pseudoflavitalea sp. G-6-1-2 TaxID=2728841 RepID=UPI00146F2D17|nr:SusD/RagB family nutrient-binding outer membrane lipoprotein [Pseudoflavitalea sp. G-6-1-2]NML21602.1 SusD/RagB family nutrient-binding outer membrane lipoprotein [Pseudoflavitalea sp. G-6-1-2]
MKRFNYILLAGCMVGAAACTKDFDKINTNKSGYSEMEPEFMITKIQTDMSGDREDTWRYDLGIASATMQHLGGSWWTRHGAHYRVDDKTHWYSHWLTTYPRELKNVQNIVDKTANDPAQVNQHAAARILRVMIYSKLTDMYGDIPYSEAIKGFTQKNLLPKYDKQEDIYKDFFKELDEAVDGLNAAAAPLKGDLFYDGNIARWKKLGNSLRLRLGFRLSKINAAESKKQVEAAIAKGVMTEAGDICMVRHMAVSYASGENRGNGRSQVFKGGTRSNGFRIAAALTDTLVATHDPRLYVFAGAYDGDVVIEAGVPDVTKYIPPMGIPNGFMPWNVSGGLGNVVTPEGTFSIDNNEKVLQPSIYVSALDAPFFHVTPAEVELLLAEAAVRGWGGQTNAKDHFNKAVQFGCVAAQHYPKAPAISQDDIDDVKAYYAGYFADDAKAMTAIHTQMWVNFFLNGTEAFANWRRTGLPNLVMFTGANGYTPGGTEISRRFFYPESEIIQNPKNYQEAVTRLGENSMFKRVWWDKP